jgi:16S rRNA (guanine966-N2)-methyltransferase
VFVEQSPTAVRVIHHNLETTGLADRARVVRADVFAFLTRPRAEESPFDLIYVAPPQYQHLWSATLQALDAADGETLLASDALIIVQIHPKEYKALSLDRLALVDQRDYGSTLLCFYQPLAGDNR